MTRIRLNLRVYCVVLQFSDTELSLHDAILFKASQLASLWDSSSLGPFSSGLTKSQHCSQPALPLNRHKPRRPRTLAKAPPDKQAPERISGDPWPPPQVGSNRETCKKSVHRGRRAQRLECPILDRGSQCLRCSMPGSVLRLRTHQRATQTRFSLPSIGLISRGDSAR